MPHLDEGTIHAWLDGALSADEAARVELHVASCEPCSDAVAEARGLIAASSRILTALDDVPRVSGARGGRRDRGDRRWFPVTSRIAAVIALVVAGGALALAVRSNSTPFLASEVEADRDNAVTLAALDSPVAEVAAPTSPPNAERPAQVRSYDASGRGAVGAVAGNTRTQNTSRERDLSAPSPDSAPMNLAQLEAHAAAAPPPAPVRTDDTARAPQVSTPARVLEMEQAEERPSVTGKIADALGARRAASDAPAAAQFAEPNPAAARMRAEGAGVSAPRLLSEQRSVEAGRAVVRRIYRVEDVLVTLDERTLLADSTVALERQRSMNLLELEQRRAPSDSVRTPAVTFIDWVDARGTTFTLSGAATREQLERIRRLLGY